MAAKCCKTCIHSRWTLTPNGRIAYEPGKCVVEVADIVLPECSRCDVPKQPSRSPIWKQHGEHCPLWSENTGKPIGEGTT